MRIVAISDTHQFHGIHVPDGDVLVHAGDFSMRGTLPELRSFAGWFQSLPHKTKVLVGGNHDRALEDSANHALFGPYVTYLQEAGVEIDGLLFWGTPYSRKPRPSNWAFGHVDGQDQYFQKIPDGTDVLITHGPPQGILDLCPGGNVGSRDLLDRVGMVRPALHIFGHIHESYGSLQTDWTTYVNAAICTGHYSPTNSATVIDLISSPEDGLVARVVDQTEIRC